MKKRIIVFLIFCSKFIVCSNFSNNKFVFGIHRNAGFFAILEGVLNKIIWAKKNYKIPVVYSWKSCPYYQSTGYRGFFKVWEYYFKPVSHLKYEQGDKIYLPFHAPDGFRISNIRGQYGSEFHGLKNYVNNIIKEYIKIRPYIIAKTMLFYKRKMQYKNIIGIHLRGTDKNKEAKRVDPLIVLSTAKKIAKESFANNCIFFIATDENRLLNIARSFLNNNIIYYPSHRSKNGRPIHYFRPPKVAALLGEEVLIEMLLLSKCQFFVHTLSNVATAVMFFNPKIKNVFVK